MAAVFEKTAGCADATFGCIRDQGGYDSVVGTGRLGRPVLGGATNGDQGARSRRHLHFRYLGDLWQREHEINWCVHSLGAVSSPVPRPGIRGTFATSACSVRYLKDGRYLTGALSGPCRLRTDQSTEWRGGGARRMTSTGQGFGGPITPGTSRNQTDPSSFGSLLSSR